jgi:short subunit dehydrogenase-like uncharacterized protein
MSESRRYNLILFGATGFTGQLVATHLAERLQGSTVRWALAGRDLKRLEALRSTLSRTLGASVEADLVVADSASPEGVSALAEAAQVIITTVGPYQDYGEGLLRACAEAGTDYLDLCGEPAWMAEMISRYEDIAQETGARILFSCGFDSIPFDLGVLFTQHEASARLGAPVTRIGGRLRGGKGAVSGGTVASLVRSIERAREDPAIRRLMGNPFALTPGFKGARQPGGSRPRRDPFTGGWLTPFIMSGINTKNVHRTQFLLGHPSGKDFEYDEMHLTGWGIGGWLQAQLIHRGLRLLIVLLALRPTRPLLLGTLLPAPGRGPSPEQQRTGYFDLMFVGVTAGGQTIQTSVGSREDPGYLSTSRVLAETALLLVESRRGVSTPTPACPGGIWTPAAALGLPLIERLRSYAGLRFDVESLDASPRSVSGAGGSSGATVPAVPAIGPDTAIAPTAPR